jgi:hypothetical protein
MRRRLGATARRPAEFVRDTDNILLLLGGIFIGLLMAFVVIPYAPEYLYRYLPFDPTFIRAGVPCTTLAAPIGEGHRSLLSFDNAEPAKLELDLIVENAPLTQGDKLKIQVVFENNDKGPITFFMPQINDMILNSGATIGAGVLVENVVTGQVLVFGIPGGSVPPFNDSYKDSELHLLEAHTQCSERYEIDTSTLPIGEYSVIVNYNNSFAGILQLPEGGIPDPAIAVDGTQNVWTSLRGIESPEIRFRIDAAVPTAVPAG